MFSAPQLQMLVDVARNTHARELACEDCFEQLDRFAELILVGKDADEALPLVRAHLNMCPECLDEFEAFMAALRASQPEPSSLWQRLRRR